MPLPKPRRSLVIRTNKLVDLRTGCVDVPRLVPDLAHCHGAVSEQRIKLRASIVHQSVESSIFGLDVLDRRFYRGVVLDVDLDGRDTALDGWELGDRVVDGSLGLLQRPPPEEELVARI